MGSSPQKIISFVLIALAFVVGSGTFFKNQIQPLCFYNELPSEAGGCKSDRWGHHCLGWR